MTSRDPSVDLMRFIGLTCIILAHTGISKDTALFQCRTFDVPLMVFTSGLAFAGKQTGKYLPFVLRRTLRLIVPVYIFLAVYALLNPVLSDWGLVERYTAERITGSFRLKLNPSIGYVWVIRVFLIVMLVTPLLVRLEKAVKKDWAFALIVIGMGIVQHLLILWLKPLKPGWFVQDWLFYVAGYSAVFLTGMRLRNASTGTKAAALGILAAIFAVMAWGQAAEHGTWLRMQAMKYPPRVYFLLWGAVCSSFLWLTKRWWTPVLDNSLFTWIGRNTIWIYLWHIPFVNIVVGGPFDGWAWGWKYIFVYAAALCIYGLQYNAVKWAESRWPGNPVSKYFVG